MTISAHGSCVCGAARYRIDGPYTFFQYCHCSRCRKASGAAHAANILLPADQLTWIEGEDRVSVFVLPDATYWWCAFCTTCGSSMPWRTRSGMNYLVPAGTLDDEPASPPTRNIYFGSSPTWYRDVAELEKHETHPG